MSNEEMAVCLGMDALRALLGIPTMNFSIDQIIEALRLVGEARQDIKPPSIPAK